jgi:ketosteroid isomerase-like protein
MRFSIDDTLQAGARNKIDRAETLSRLTTMWQLRAAGDIDGMMAFAADDVVCFPPSSWGGARFPFTLRGKAAVREAMWQRHIHFIYSPTVIHRLLIDGDEVVVHRTSQSRPRGGGVLSTYDCVDFLRLRDGLIVEAAEFCDGAACEAVVNFPY